MEGMTTWQSLAGVLGQIFLILVFLLSPNQRVYCLGRLDVEGHFHEALGPHSNALMLINLCFFLFTMGGW